MGCRSRRGAEAEREAVVNGGEMEDPKWVRIWDSAWSGQRHHQRQVFVARWLRWQAVRDAADFADRQVRCG